MINEFIDFLKHSRKFGLKTVIKDLININKLYLQTHYIKQILNFARENNYKFTFFMTAKNLKKRKKLINQIIKDGHEIGSHCYHHILLENKDYNTIYKELKIADNIFKKNNIEVKGFRAPFLSINDNVIKVLKELKYKYSSNIQYKKTFTYKNKIKEVTIISPYDWEGFMVRNLNTNELFQKWQKQKGVFLLHPWLFTKYLNKFKEEFLKNKKDFRIIKNLNSTSVSFDIY